MPTKTITKLRCDGPAFESEAELVSAFMAAIGTGKSCFGRLETTTEWDHRSGLVDVLARDTFRTLIAFEAKLDNWRRAFLQAYRNMAYANRAYVLLPECVVHRAMGHREEFEFRGVGLCTFDGKKVRIHIEAVEQDALLVWLRDRAHLHFDALTDDRPGSGGRRERVVQAARI